MRRSRRHASLALAIAVGTAGCGGTPDVHDLSQSARSWAATAQLTGDRWAHGAITRHYAIVTLERTSSELAQLTESSKRVRDTSALVTRAHATLTAQLATTRDAVAALDSAATTGDRKHTSAAQTELARAGAILDSVSAATEQK